MPSSQMQVVSNGQANGAGSKHPPPLPPPSKLPPPPPPPPPPPKFTRLPPPPPPPPRNSSQSICQNNVVQVGQGCGTVGLAQNVSGMLNSGSSMSSLNSAGRCSHPQSMASGSIPAQHCQRNLMKFNDNCSSRSSVSSHSSLQHHHHGNINHPLPNSSGSTSNFSSVCNHQGNTGCLCQPQLTQHNHMNSSSMSDTGSFTYGQNNRSVSSSNCGGCCGSNNTHHMHNVAPKFQQNQAGFNMGTNLRGNSVMSSPIATTINRNTLFHGTENANINQTGVGGELRGHCQNSCTHHHHHHALHDAQGASNSSGMSPPQPVEGLSNSFHRCHGTQSNTISSLPSLMSDQNPRPAMNNHCGHTHRANVCNHHHQAINFCDHHVNPVAQQQPSHQFNSCSHPHHGRASPNIMMGKGFTASCNPTRHYTQDSNHANRSSDISNNDSLLSTTHTHNLSNSSTTTHTSNVAVKHQPQSFLHPNVPRGNRSNSSQHYEQYGQSSAASTSSATPSLSNYHAQPGCEDLIPLYPSKIHQPLPPPPSRMPHAANNNLNFNSNNSNNNNNHNSHSNNNNHMNSNQVPVMTTTLINTLQVAQSMNSMHPLPPLPPKPISPNTSSCSTQITTVTTSPSFMNQPITRVTSQAGVQNPLPRSDTPPPLPPLNPSSRPQPVVSAPMTRVHQQMSFAPNHQLISFASDHHGDQMTEAERKTEALTRQIELELERQKKTGEPHGICFKCGDKVMPAQEACKAMNEIYHASCFVCSECNRTLLGKTFYPVLDKVYCEEDFKYTGHMQSLEKCAACSQPIVDMILPAMGKSYHPKCFKCCICGQCLDGVPFTIDMKDKIYCVEDYHTIYSPKCAACGKSISPIDGTGETVRVVSMEKDYHIDCYCCEDCGLQLTDEEPSQSYPLDNHLLCQRCHINRLSEMQAGLTLREVTNKLTELN